jgi:hypothetical protein
MSIFVPLHRTLLNGAGWYLEHCRHHMHLKRTSKFCGAFLWWEWWHTVFCTMCLLCSPLLALCVCYAIPVSSPRSSILFQRVGVCHWVYLVRAIKMCRIHVSCTCDVFHLCAVAQCMLCPKHTGTSPYCLWNYLFNHSYQHTEKNNSTNTNLTSQIVLSITYRPPN